jgi:hypothetical protein
MRFYCNLKKGREKGVSGILSLARLPIPPHRRFYFKKLAIESEVLSLPLCQSFCRRCPTETNAIGNNGATIKPDQCQLSGEQYRKANDARKCRIRSANSFHSLREAVNGDFVGMGADESSVRFIRIKWIRRSAVSGLWAGRNRRSLRLARATKCLVGVRVVWKLL